MEFSKIAKRSCGTCRDRRISCDRAIPSCLQCYRSSRMCKGYGIRLSWPSTKDHRRAITVRSDLQRGPARSDPRIRFISVSNGDIRMHHHLTCSSAEVFARPMLRIPMPWRQSALKGKDLDMVQYFQCVASQSLTVFGQDPAMLGNVIMRLALRGDTPSAAAVCQSLLALSSLHRYGVQEEAVQFKISSLRALASASKGELGMEEIAQHVAASMLLCSFEVHQASCTSSQWTWYISAIENILRTASLLQCDPKRSMDIDWNHLLKWVYYHEVMGQFVLSHWEKDLARVTPCSSTETIEDLMPRHPGKIRYPVCQRLFSGEPAIAAILNLLGEISAAVSTRPWNVSSTQSRESTQSRDDFKSHLKLLDWRLKQIEIPKSDDPSREMALVVELHKLAALIYLNRAFEDYLNQPVNTQHQVDRAFSLFRQLTSCERQFPVFVVGCEARTDEQRVIILDLVTRTQKKASSRSLNHVTILFEAVWNQDDLANSPLDYWQKLSYIISSCAIVPSLV